MRIFSRKPRTVNRSAKKVNHLCLESLEPRILLSGDDLLHDAFYLSSAMGGDAKPLIRENDLVAMPDALQQQAQQNQVAAGASGINPLESFSYSTLPNGMPILDSYPNNPSHATIFLDFDGTASSEPLPYTEDADATTFNAAEQATIVEAWRQMAMYYSMFDVTVTTVQPNVSVTPTAWITITPSEGNGWSWVGVYPNSGVSSFVASYFAQSRESGIAHEIGHNFGDWHTSDYDSLGNKTAEYSSGFNAAALSPLQGPIMGVDYAGVIHKWTEWHGSGSVDSLQDDMVIIANSIKAHAPAGYTGDGYRPDDYGGTIATATPLTSSGTPQSAVGIIERLSDADAFSFTSSGGRYSITAGRDAPSGVDLKLSIYNSSGTLIASEDGDPRTLPYSMVNDQHLTLDLSTGTYYAIAESHGNYGDQGQYVLRVDPLPGAWKSDDVGLPGVPGYSGYDAATGTYTVAGTGDDIWNTSDSFQFAYQTLSGDGSITARITSMTNTAYYAKSGVMIRESLDGGSRFADIVMTPTAGIYSQYRTATGGGCSNSGSRSATAPYWLQLSRTGNTFTFKVSSNGTSWSTLGSVSISMGATVYIGLVSESQNNVKSNAATFTNVSLTGNLNPGPTLNALPAPDPLTVTGKTSSSISLSWSNASGESGYSVERSSDNINFKQIGTTAADSTTYTDNGLSDVQRYYYRVRAQDSGGAVSVPSSVVNAITRAGAVSNLRVISYTTSELVLDWIDASGETGYRVERSPNGTGSWTTVATLGKNVPLYANTGLTANTQYYYRVVTLDSSGDAATSAIVSRYTRLAAVTGLAFSSKAPNQIAFSWNARAGATSYRIERSTDGSTFTTLASNVSATNYTDNTVLPLGEYYYRVVGLNANIEGVPSAVVFAAAPAAAALPTPWLTQDIGSVGGSGAAKYASGTLTVVGSGADVWGTSDAFRFVYQPLSGDGSLIARVVSQDNSDTYAKSGVMIRETLTAGSKNAFTEITPGAGAIFQYRSSTSGSSTSLTPVTAAAPYWVKITRSGNTFTSEVSSDGSTWTAAGSATIAMNADVYIGLAVNSHNNALLNTTTFSVTALTNAAPTVATPASSTPSPVLGTTATLSARGADDHGEGNLTYTWAATSIPSGAPAPTYSVNGTNAARDTVVTFGKAGAYTFGVTMTDSDGLTTTSTVSVTVDPTLTTIAVSPASVLLPMNGIQQFTATAKDQFGAALSSQPSFTWSATAGSISAGGLFTAPGVSTPVTISATSGALSGTATALVGNVIPTVATPAAATPNPVTGTMANLSVLGADDGGEANLTYIWTATTLPAGAAVPTYSVNGVNAAKTTTATFSQTGNYVFQVTIADLDGFSTTSSVSVTVNQTVTTIIVSPASVTLAPNGTQQFTATGIDQFGNALSVQPTFNWSAVSGSITAGGLYTAPAVTPPDTVSATIGSISGTATVTVVNTAPTVATAVSAAPNPVADTTTILSVLGADDGGESNLTYTWTAYLMPTGAAQPTYTDNGTNSAKYTTAIFSSAGTYLMRVTIADGGSLTVKSQKFVTVNQTLTSIVVSPASVELPPGGTQQFAATAFDQFGIVMSTAFTWSSTAGSITTGGLYTAPVSLTTATVQVVSGSVSGTATVNAANLPPSDILLSNSAIAEDEPGAGVGTLTTIDPDQNESYAYVLQNDPTGKFEIAGSILRLKAGQSIDFETTPSVDLIIRTTDSGGLSYDKTFSIAILDQSEPMVASVENWPENGLTLTLGGDGKLHLYETGTTVDAVPPHDPTKVSGLNIFGRDTNDVLSDDYAGAFAELLLDHATLRLDQDNALSADTNVTINGGILDSNGHTSALGNFTLTSGGQANIAAINNTTTTVSSGTLTATSIVCDTLTIGPSSGTAAKTVSTSSASTSSAAPLAAAMPSSVASDHFSATVVKDTAISTTKTDKMAVVERPLIDQGSLATGPALHSIVILPATEARPALSRAPVVNETISTAEFAPSLVLPEPTVQPAETATTVKVMLNSFSLETLYADLSAARGFDRQYLPTFTGQSLATEGTKVSVVDEVSDSLARATKQSIATAGGQDAHNLALQSLLGEFPRSVAAEQAESELLAGRHFRKQEKLITKAVDEFHLQFVASD